MEIEPEVNDPLEEEQLTHRFKVFGYKLKYKLEYSPYLLDFSIFIFINDFMTQKFPFEFYLNTVHYAKDTFNETQKEINNLDN